MRASVSTRYSVRVVVVKSERESKVSDSLIGQNLESLVELIALADRTTNPVKIIFFIGPPFDNKYYLPD